jgi:predicted TIM-barrel fold metal-dependent hydrolase
LTLSADASAAMAAADSPATLRGAIDVWVNLFTPEACRRVYYETEELKDLVDWWHIEEIARGTDTAAFLAALDRVGVDKVIIPSMKMWSFKHKRQCYSIEVDEVSAVAEAAPGRIFGAYGCDPYARMAAVRGLEVAVRERGFVAAHIHPYGYNLPLNAADWYPFYAKCVELDVPVLVQTGHSAEFMPNAVARPMLMDDVALYFPELKIVCCHMGWPWVEEQIALAWKHPNVFIATTAHAPRYWDPRFVQFANTRGQDKVLFGTDWPVITHERAAREIAQLGMRPVPLQKLLRGNALRVFSRIEG